MNHKEKGTILDNFRILSHKSFEINLKRLHSHLRQTFQDHEIGFNISQAPPFHHSKEMF